MWLAEPDASVRGSHSPAAAFVFDFAGKTARAYFGNSETRRRTTRTPRDNVSDC